MNGCFSCGISVCIDTSVKLFVFLFVCGVYLSAGSLIDTMSDLQSSAIRSTNASSNVTEDQFFYLIHEKDFGTICMWQCLNFYQSIGLVTVARPEPERWSGSKC